MIPVTFIWIMLSLIAVGMPIVFALGAAPMIGLLLAGKDFFLAIEKETGASAQSFLFNLRMRKSDGKM